MTSSKVFSQLVQALSCLQEAGFCHRDLKPENILVDKGMNVKLIDFGLAVDVNEQSSELSTKYGTAIYMSPEILR